MILVTNHNCTHNHKKYRIGYECLVNVIIMNNKTMTDVAEVLHGQCVEHWLRIFPRNMLTNTAVMYMLTGVALIGCLNAVSREQIEPRPTLPFRYTTGMKVWYHFITTPCTSCTYSLCARPLKLTRNCCLALMHVLHDGPKKRPPHSFCDERSKSFVTCPATCCRQHVSCIGNKIVASLLLDTKGYKSTVT